MILVLTSLYLFTNFISAFIREHHVYSILFLILTITSVINHTISNLYGTNSSIQQMDRIAVYSVAVYGAYHLYIHMSWDQWFRILIIISTFFCTILLYEYGCREYKYCFDPNPIIAQMYHGYMHMIGSIGHHLIIAL